MICNGNTSETCGGANRLDVYASNAALTSPTSTTSGSSQSPSSSAPAGWASLGCYIDSVGARTLETEIYSIPGASMTVELCTAACFASGFTLAGVEYAGECYCDNTFHNGGGPAPDGNTLCDLACNGNAAEICGGSNRLSLYSRSSSSSAPTATSSGSATSPTPGPTVTGLPSGWTYKGCWVDQEYGRILIASEPDSSTLTIESCVATCSGLGYSVAGMEYYTQCYCGDAIINRGVLTTAQTDCNTACGGNSAEMCGGGNRMSIYSNQTTLYIQPVPAVQSSSLPGNWEYQGCLM
jgi:hypothetical protein